MQSPPDSWEQLSWQAAVFTALLAAIIALIQAGWALWQRGRDLRWKQAELARQMMDEWFDTAPSDAALTMLDEGVGDYTLERLGTFHIEPARDIPNALRLVQSGKEQFAASRTPEHQLVRRSFDTLFYFWERAEHSIKIGVVREEDLCVPTGYYVNLLVPYHDFVLPYIHFIGYTRAELFLQRFEVWPKPEKRDRSGPRSR